MLGRRRAQALAKLRGRLGLDAFEAEIGDRRRCVPPMAVAFGTLPEYVGQDVEGPGMYTGAGFRAFVLLFGIAGPVAAAAVEPSPGVSGCPSLAIVESTPRDARLPPVLEETVQFAPLELKALDAAACAVTFLGQTPPLRAVYLEEGPERWTLVHYDAKPTESASSAVARAVRGSWRSGSEADLARDVLLLILDPLAESAVLLTDADSIPTDLKSSEAYRELAARGLTEQAIRLKLLSEIGFPISPPHVEQQEGHGRLVFLVWEYFGGLVTRVTLPLDPADPAGAAIEILARGVGSWAYRL